MAGNPFPTIQTNDPILNRIQANVSNAISQLIGPFIGGNLLSSVKLTSGQANVVSHKLGRAPQVWVLCDQSAGTSVWRTAWDANSITLEAGADCTISLWVN